MSTRGDAIPPEAELLEANGDVQDEASQSPEVTAASCRPGNAKRLMLDSDPAGELAIGHGLSLSGVVSPFLDHVSICIIENRDEQFYWNTGSFFSKFTDGSRHFDT